MRYLHFGSVRGDLQEGHVYAKRLRDYASQCQFPHFPSTKSRFLCFFGLRDPCFRAFRAQNRVFCALLGSGSSVFRLFEHKIEVFVRFWPSRPSFSGFSAHNRHFCARLLNWMSGLGHFPADRGIVAPAEPILPLTLPPLHLRNRCASCRCSPLHLRSRCARCRCLSQQPTPVAPDGACGLEYHSGLGGGVEDVVD